MLESTIRLFKSIPISDDVEMVRPSLKYVRRGFIFGPEVTGVDLDAVANMVEKSFGLSPEKVNSSFHKSWQKIKDSSIEELILEQITHYFSTYGADYLGIYNGDHVFIPRESLDIPDVDIDNIQLVVIHGFTTSEIKERLMSLLGSGIALSEQSIADAVEIAINVVLAEDEVRQIKNREVQSMLYDHYDIMPRDPVDFLRLTVYRATGKTLLIKNRSLINEIKGSDKSKALKCFSTYEKLYGLDGLAEIFYRFKPLFLAFRLSAELKRQINKIRKLAVVKHKPMASDFINDVTGIIKNGGEEVEQNLNEALCHVNTFRKIRLAYALKYRTLDTDSILYRVRNGRSYATEFSIKESSGYEHAFNIVTDSIINDISKNVEGKNIYIPENISYALPSTEKQFTGEFPSGTCVKSNSDDLIVGVYWDNVNNIRIDLDLALVTVSGKVGWDSSYRSDNGGVLFSGDMTDARDGASELFYVSKNVKGTWLVTLNYYNHHEDVDVPFKILVADEKPTSFKQNYMVDPNNIISITSSSTSEKQLVLGIIVSDDDGVRFYYAETALGNRITSGYDTQSKQAMNYLVNYYTNSIDLRDILGRAGANVVDYEDSDIDFSPTAIDKQSIINLFV